MDKRQFLLATALGLPAMRASASGRKTGTLASGPAVLTVTGLIGRTNRGPLDKLLDQLMSKHGLQFERAFSFDLSVLADLPQVNIRPTLEYDARPHQLRGPLMIDVLRMAGVSKDGTTRITLRGIDGYAPVLTLADMSAHDFIVATHIDGQPMAIGGLGPLWAIYEADRFPEMASKPVNERFAGCPWGLYHIGVQAA
jgi:hypothetical protein